MNNKVLKPIWFHNVSLTFHPGGIMAYAEGHICWKGWPLTSWDETDTQAHYKQDMSSFCLENATLLTLNLQLPMSNGLLGVFDVSTLTGKVIRSNLLNFVFSLWQKKKKKSAIGTSLCNLLKFSHFTY